VIFQVLTAASMKMTVFWGVVLCSLIEIVHRFRGAYSLHGHRSDDGVVSTSETLVSFYETTCHNIVKDIQGSNSYLT
jgi:hypothetical protein